jgi:hypothetical protein
LSRLPVAAFGALVLATIGAFFVSQHLKVSTPLIAGIGPPAPGAINPVGGLVCGGIDYRRAKFSFYLLHKADSVDVYVIDQNGTVVRTLASGRHMRRGVRIPDGVFYWNGREDDHRVAPDGTYEIEVALIQQGRTVTLGTASGPETVTVKTVAPRPVVDGVWPHLIPRRGRSVTIRYSGNEGRGGTVRLYRTDLNGPPRLVKTFLTPWKGQTAVWDGKIRRRPAPAGTYLVGLEVTDAACNTGYFPPKVPPAPGVTAHDGVTVRYLAAQPPLDPVPAASAAVVRVDAARRRYGWSLLRDGQGRPVASGASAASVLRAPLPAGRAGLYELRLRSGAHATAVPVVASAPAPARALVVLPALTWQGLNPVDDTGDGLPATLTAGGPIRLARPFAHGLPSGFADEAGLLAYLDASHLAYQLTTDLGLVDGIGPRLSGHTSVVLAGSETWLPAATAAALRSYVQAGGHVLAMGIDSLRRSVTVTGGRALDPTGPAANDALGAQRTAPVEHGAGPLTVSSDSLGIFEGTPGTFPGYRAYQPIRGVAASGGILSAAGAQPSAPGIVGYQLGRGTVVEIAVAGFGAGLRTDAAARALVARVWNVLGGS